MPSTAGHTDFRPETDIPSLEGKVILVTGGTAGLGYQSVLALARHNPAHIYFTGRNAEAGNRLTAEIRAQGAATGASPPPPTSFLKLDMSDLGSVKSAINSGFTHDRLDVLMCSAGVMATPPELSRDGYEMQFSVNHLAHAMIIDKLLPVLLRTAKTGADVRIVSLSSAGWKMHPRGGINFDSLDTVQDGTFGSWTRYGQSKLANVVYARELARRFPQITSVSVHPGISTTGLVTGMPLVKRMFVYTTAWMGRLDVLPPEKAVLNQLWTAAGADKDELVNGGYYTPIGVSSEGEFDETARSPEMAKRLWEWTRAALETA